MTVKLEKKNNLDHKINKSGFFKDIPSDVLNQSPPTMRGFILVEATPAPDQETPLKRRK